MTRLDPVPKCGVGLPDRLTSDLTLLDIFIYIVYNQYKILQKIAEIVTNYA